MDYARLMKWSRGMYEGDPSVAMMAGRHIPQPTPPQPIRPQIAPAKKLWGVEEGKTDNKGIFNIGEPTWREAAWSTGHPTDHGVGQSHGLSMGVGQRGPGRPQFPGGDSVLSPRASDHAGVGLKMVEYVLASSPTGKDLDARMANLQLRNGGVETSKDKKDKAPSPFDPTKKDVENGNAPQANGIVQNGLDDDKTFNRTPGSRQGSPSEEDINKNGMVTGVGVKEPELVGGGVVMGGPSAQVLGHLDHPGFEGVGGGAVGGGAVGGMGGPAGILDPSMSGAGGPFSSPAGPDYSNMATSMPMDSPTLLPGPQPQNFTDNQVQQKLETARGKFSEIRKSLSEKWNKLKTLSSPENFANLGKKTLTKMNRVIVNVVNKLKNIGQNVFMKRGKTPVDKTISTMAERLSVLDTQLDKTWNDLEAEVEGEADEGVSVDEEPEAPQEDLEEKKEKREAEKKESEAQKEQQRQQRDGERAKAKGRRDGDRDHNDGHYHRDGRDRSRPRRTTAGKSQGQRKNLFDDGMTKPRCSFIVSCTLLEGTKFPRRKHETRQEVSSE
ncbi:hypothetical protein C7M84_001002 [Penaeus vannamei]|uniref:Uncharacterized protein n=1 Tax=Penaeus vannamei TaxID=6689 RepID=A0A3R7N8P0_PENVA|nr:hypothetical protein C7M84_001002 [Penaeus vannamei]